MVTKESHQGYILLGLREIRKTRRWCWLSEKKVVVNRAVGYSEKKLNSIPNTLNPSLMEDI
jgi:hypothetical protein